jgi:addiction module HigA family antidote
MIKNLKPLHPGVVLNEVYLKEMRLNQSQLAELIGCLPKRINEVIKGKRGISPQLALELENVIGTSAEMWGGCKQNMILALPEKKPLKITLN